LVIALEVSYAGLAMLNATLRSTPQSKSTPDSRRMRDRFPTSPYDLSEYARLHTGPTSWSARDDDELDAPNVEPIEDEISDLLCELWQSDIPKIASDSNELSRVDHREAFVLSLIDGESNVESLLTVADLPQSDVLSILCDLCERGIVTLDRSKRAHRGT
jgi:hypothetical protein